MSNEKINRFINSIPGQSTWDLLWTKFHCENRVAFSLPLSILQGLECECFSV